MTPTPPQAAPSEQRGPIVQLTLSENDFREHGQPHARPTVELEAGSQLVVTLGSNPSTGHAWNEQAEVDDAAVLRQLQHRFSPPGQALPGAGGQQQWVLLATQRGETLARWRYGRPWIPQDAVWTLTLTVKVR